MKESGYSMLPQRPVVHLYQVLFDDEAEMKQQPGTQLG